MLKIDTSQMKVYCKGGYSKDTNRTTLFDRRTICLDLLQIWRSKGGNICKHLGEIRYRSQFAAAMLPARRTIKQEEALNNG